MSRFKMPTAYHPSNTEWVYPIESLTSDGVKELQRLKIENLKLWELVQEMHATISDRNAWWDCTFKDTKRFADRIQKLRAKVDE